MWNHQSVSEIHSVEVLEKVSTYNIGMRRVLEADMPEIWHRSEPAAAQKSLRATS
jgi:hypothetical protein